MFNGNEEITCCGDSLPVRKSQLACDLYRLQNGDYIDHLIPDANLGEFPHMAALGYLAQENNEQIVFKCGGSLISDRYILTAAHCVKLNKLEPIVARLGSLLITNKPDYRSNDFGNVLDVNVEYVTIHPEYVPSKNYHDIALAYLAKIVPFDNYLHPACLNTDVSEVLPSTNLVVSYWVKPNTSYGETFELLQRWDLRVENLIVHNKTFSYDYFCRYKVCDECLKNSGDPVQFFDDQLMPIILGIRSFGSDCGIKPPSVFVLVAFYLDWIESIVWPN